MTRRDEITEQVAGSTDQHVRARGRGARLRCRPRAAIVWFKRDLRLADHAPLAAAAEAGAILPLLIVEPAWWAEPDMSARQFAFMRESALELDADLARLGQRLIVRIGQCIDVFSELAREIDIAAVHAHEETGNSWTYARDRAVIAWCRARGIPFYETRQDGVVRRLVSRNGWANNWDQRMAQPIRKGPEALAPLPREIPTARFPTPEGVGMRPDPCPARQPGGRRAGEATLASFLGERSETYRSAMSSPLTAERACSRLSPHLAWGTLSMREVAQATWARQRELKRVSATTPIGGWRSSLVSFSGRLHWHCHFMQKLEDEPALEFRNLHPAYDGLRCASESDASRLAAWCNGETGLPFVDACMRYLNTTGWLNFRMRAMLMATASYHLWLDWRAPGLHLARRFTDYEPGIHWPQAQMQSGTTGINTVRIYNPVKQGYDQDPDGSFTRRWVPELADIPGAAIHEPWTHPMGQRRLGKAYPERIVDHVEAARVARERIYGVRKSGSFRDTAEAIQTKHGSRKSGLPLTGHRRAPAHTKAAARRSPGSANPQLSFDLDHGLQGDDA
ncbi:MAG: FAD-binding domain-containing protein [Hyphomicrobiaceae bacterium]